MAFEGLLSAWSNERIAYRDQAFCVLDKPAGIGVVSEPPGGARRVGPSGEDWASHALGGARLLWSPPVRASGAALLALGGSVGPLEGTGREQEALSDAGEVLDDRIEVLTYVLGVEGWTLPPSGCLPAAGARGGAALVYRVSRRNGARALVEVTGRVTASDVLARLRGQGQQVVGDDATNAPAATRLLLHVLRLRGPVSAEAPLPTEFDAWLVGSAVLPPDRFAVALRAAAPARGGLWPAVGAYRLLGEEAGEIAGVTVERYGDHAVLSLSSDEAAQHEREMTECLMDHGAVGVYVKRRVRADLRGLDPATLAPRLPVRGAPAPEPLALPLGSFRAWVNLGDGLATGLFLDQRANWGRLAAGARGGAVLNLFSYTGAFTLAAASGGAAATISVDLSGRALTRLGKNLELNAWSGPRHRLLKADVPEWLGRAGRRSQRFDAIVLDPPSFGTRSRGVLSTRRDNPGLLEAALGLLAPGGCLLCVSHHRKISELELCEQVARACAASGREARVAPLVGAWDCATLPGVSGTKSVLAQLS